MLPYGINIKYDLIIWSIVFIVMLLIKADFLLS